MILCFNGTGNSLFVAKQISDLIEDHEIISINQFLKEGKKDMFRTQRPLVFVVPIYCWRIPRVVEQWILENNFEGGANVYFITTCASGCGNAAAYTEKLCEKKGFRFCGLAPVIMPENYLALFPTPNESECRKIIENAIPRISELSKQIRAGECFTRPVVSLYDKLKSGPVNPLFYKLFVHDKGFTVSDRCISCGKCSSVCPMNNIGFENGKPIWKGHCTHCIACIGGCPAKAIEYKSRTKERHHHYIMDDSLYRDLKASSTDERTYR